MDGVSADIYENFYTQTETDQAITNAVSVLASSVNSELGNLNAELQNNHYTKADSDSAIANSINTLQTLIEDPNGTSLGAALFNNYSTTVDMQSAISEASTQLQASIDQASADIYTNVYTVTQADTAISDQVNSLRAAVDNDLLAVTTGIDENYYTKAETDAAYSQADLLLKSSIENIEGSSLGATLHNDYSTTVEMDEAITVATTQLRATLEDPNGTSLAADIYQNFYTKTAADEAISSAVTSIISEFEDPESGGTIAELFDQFQTKTGSQEAIANTTSVLRAEFEISAESIIENALANDIAQDRNRLVEAEIIDTQNVIASEQKSATEVIGALISSVGESQSELQSIKSTVAEEKLSTSNELTKLSSEVGNVRADLVENFYTKANADEAISSATTALKSEIEDPEGNSIGAYLQENFITKVDANSAIAQAQTTLSSRIGDVESNLEQNFYTEAQIDLAIAQTQTLLSSKINDVESIIFENYYTEAQVDQAIAQRESILSSQINNVSSNLYLNYYTKATTDQAISQSQQALESQLGSVYSSLYNDYYTKAATNSAISQAKQTLSSEINGVSAELESVSQTVANNQGVFSALWGVKTTVNGISASVGLVNDGSEPLFVVKAAKFAVITNQDPNSSTPFFAVSGNKTVINNAVIDDAYIKSLVTDDLLANRVIVGSSFSAPSINYNRSNGARSGNFSIDPNGNMLAKSATLESVTIKDYNGNVMLSSGGIAWDSVTGSGKPESGADKTSNNVALGTAISDTRNSNDSPDTYWNYKGQGTFTEFKSRTAIGAPGAGSFGTLVTTVGWRDSSGGKITQVFYGDYGTYRRTSVSGTSWSSWQKSYDEQNKPYLNDIPDSGRFAGLDKILSSNVTTYIANGAIGSAQIDQAYINTLFGNNASFFGTVYAANIEGDVTDLKVKTSSNVNANSTNSEYTVINFYISSLPFARSVTVSGIQVKAYHEYYDAPSVDVMLFVSGFTTARDVYRHEFSDEPGTETVVTRTLAAIIPAYTSVTVTLKIKKTSVGGTHSISAPGQNIVCQTFKDGSTIS